MCTIPLKRMAMLFQVKGIQATSQLKEKISIYVGTNWEGREGVVQVTFILTLHDVHACPGDWRNHFAWCCGLRK